MARKKMPDSVNSTPIVAPTGKMRRRMFYIIFVAILVFAGYISYVLYQTAVAKSEYYRARANAQQLTRYTLSANRGTIYDRNGKILAQSTTVWDVVINPQQIRKFDSETRDEKGNVIDAGSRDDDGDGVPDGNVLTADGRRRVEEIAEGIAEITGTDYETLIDRIENDPNQYYVVKRKVDSATKDALLDFIAENGLNQYSIPLMENSKRYYPNDNLAASVIGFTNYDNDGVYGLEAYYDDYLKGVDGLVVMAKDSYGNAMPYDYENRHEASDGNSLILTIDEVVQHYLEKNLEMALTQYGVANRAAGIIMNAKTGAIVAMATAPSFDLNNPSTLSDYDRQQLIDLEEELILDYAAGSMTDQDAIRELIDNELEETEAAMREKQWNNKAISELYFPGSVFKDITCAAALEEEVISLNSTFDCFYVKKVADREFHCHLTSGHGAGQSLQDAFAASCNPAFIEIGLRLGSKLFTSYFEAFGFTEKTGIDLPGESLPLYVPYERMGQVELASSAFGQTNKITPLQMICAFAATINGGYLVTPHVVDKIVDSDGNVVKTADAPIKRQVISEETSAMMRELTENIVIKNGGSNAKIPGFRIGGKSGTSQKLDLYGEYNMRYVGSFCGFTPANDPEYIMLVMVDEPLGGKYYGSMVAAPVVSAVFSESLEYLGVYPQYTAEELELQNTTVPYVYNFELLDAITSINERGLKYEIIGDENGGKVSHTVPAAALQIPRNGTVVIYMEGAGEKTALVPYLIGKTVEEVNRELTNAGLNVSLSGGAINNAEAKASLQSVEAGSLVSLGTVVEVTFLVDEGEGG
ncbi:MAG: penicillin-binding transpeptidase domain-containing protein [Bacteroides sp.]|nr:penicillin-binding transpeptidase domain-containing protein [Eubacterium sp.]MCM1418328.1 penicillin-binding transpeptidase domain-containing protein [Roseburia sp.]MCM1463393.1 penicillin-binding transpeptidase domain-containing protein [Bacteroides sp.]